MPTLIAVVAGAVACVGLLVLIMGIVWFPSQRKVAKELAFLRQVPLRPCAEVSRDPGWDRYSAVQGRSAPGPHGPQTAPLSGRPCVWYRVEAVRVMSETVGEHLRTWREELWSTTAGEPFAVADESGPVAVSARLLDTNSTWVRFFATDDIAETSARERSERQPGPYLSRLIAAGVVDPKRVRVPREADRVEISETLIPGGKPLFVVARPRLWHGIAVLAPEGIEYNAISTYPRERVTSARPQPGARADAPAGCGFALLAVGAVLVLAGALAAYLAIS